MLRLKTASDKNKTTSMRPTNLLSEADEFLPTLTYTFRHLKFCFSHHPTNSVSLISRSSSFHNQLHHLDLIIDKSLTPSINE